jgi:hypothetical protein
MPTLRAGALQALLANVDPRSPLKVSVLGGRGSVLREPATSVEIDHPPAPNVLPVVHITVDYDQQDPA